MSIIPTAFLNAVVAIGINIKGQGQQWIGTGFIVGRKEVENPDLSTHFLITNKHVIENRQSIFVRFNSLGGQFVKDYPINLIDNKGNHLFSVHPHKNTDIIAIQIAPQTLIKDKSIWGSFDLKDEALSLEQMQQTGVDEGSLIYALGFPMNLVEKIKAPICRLGCISRVIDAFVLKESFPTFLVDAQTFPGNSGGPIISRPEHLFISGATSNGKAYLIGVLSAYIPYKETLISSQTGHYRMIQEENSGLTVVHPVDRIKELVEIELKRIEKLNATNVVDGSSAQNAERGEKGGVV